MVILGIDAHKRTHTVVASTARAGSWRRRHSAPRPPTTWACCAGPTRFGDPTATESVGGRGLPAPVPAAGADLLSRRRAVVRVPPKLMAHARDSPARTASPTRSTRWRWPGRRCASRTCPPPGWTAPTGRCGCWSITAKTWSPNGPARSTGCAGTCTSSTRAGIPRRARWTGVSDPATRSQLGSPDDSSGTGGRLARDLVDRGRELTGDQRADRRAHRPGPARWPRRCSRCPAAAC